MPGGIEPAPIFCRTRDLFTPRAFIHTSIRLLQLALLRALRLHAELDSGICFSRYLFCLSLEGCASGVWGRGMEGRYASASPDNWSGVLTNLLYDLYDDAGDNTDIQMI